MRARKRPDAFQPRPRHRRGRQISKTASPSSKARQPAHRNPTARWRQSPRWWSTGCRSAASAARIARLPRRAAPSPGWPIANNGWCCAGLRHGRPAEHQAQVLSGQGRRVPGRRPKGGCAHHQQQAGGHRHDAAVYPRVPNCFVFGFSPGRRRRNPDAVHAEGIDLVD